jgi:hypothetical protein
MASRKGRKQKSSGEIGEGLEEKNGIEPCVGPEAREKKLECGEEDGIGGQAIGGGRKIGAGAHAVDAVMQQIVA